MSKFGGAAQGEEVKEVKEVKEVTEVEQVRMDVTVESVPLVSWLVVSSKSQKRL